MSDPALRNAVEYAATRADCARQRVRRGRRRAWLVISFAVTLALAVRGLLWLIVL